MRTRWQIILVVVAITAMLAPAAAIASHEEGAQPAQGAQPVPSQGAAPQPTAPPEEDDEGANGLLIAGIVAGLLVLAGGLAVAKDRRGGPRPAAE